MNIKIKKLLLLICMLLAIPGVLLLLQNISGQKNKIAIREQKSPPCQINTPPENLQDIVDQYRLKMNSSALAVSISLPHSSKIITFTSGTLSNINKTPINENSLFEIGSITKSYTSVLVLQLVSAGYLQLNDSLTSLAKKHGEWIPQKYIDKWHNVTVLQLLNMTSGIYSYSESNVFNQTTKINPTKIWQPNELIDIAFKQPVDFPAGFGWHYSDTNYIILGQLIEAITNMPLTSALEKHILNHKKLALDHTFYIDRTISKQLAKNRVQGYNASLHNVANYNLSAANAAGAIFSTSNNIVKWVRILFKSNFLTENQRQQLMQTVDTENGQVTSNPNKNAFGLGIARFYANDREGVNWAYLGGTYGFLAYYTWLPKSDVVIAATVNRGNDPDDVSHIMPFAKILQRDLINAIYRNIAYK